MIFVEHDSTVDKGSIIFVNADDMTDEEKTKIEKEAAEQEATVIPTGRDKPVRLLKFDIIEFVYYFKKPIEDILGMKWEEAKKYDDLEDYYIKWISRIQHDRTMYTMAEYSDFLEKASRYIHEHGVFKGNFVK